MNGGNHQDRIDTGTILRRKFVGRNREPVPTEELRRPPMLPAEIRRAAQVLGLDPAEDLSSESIYRGWRREISSTNAHPDLGGETEIAILLNTAKDELLQFVETRAPKLGKQFPYATS